jgi:hypothetical protein
VQPGDVEDLAHRREADALGDSRLAVSRRHQQHSSDASIEHRPGEKLALELQPALPPLARELSGLVECAGPGGGRSDRWREEQGVEIVWRCVTPSSVVVESAAWLRGRLCDRAETS